MRFSLLIFLVGVVFANPYQQGSDLGNRFINTYGKGNYKSRIQKPLTGEDTFRDMQGKSLGFSGPFCKPQNQQRAEILKVSINGQNIQIWLSSNGQGLNRYYSFSAPYHCAGTICWSLDPPNCSKFYVSGGSLYTTSGEPVSCSDSRYYPQPPTLIASEIINSLISDYQNRGIQVNLVDQDLRENTVVYIGGSSDQCGESAGEVSLTKYADSPYSLESDGIAYYSSCNPSDVSCRAIRTAGSSVSSKKLAYCTIERKFVQDSDRICSPNQEILPYGYSETSGICFMGDKWKAFSSSFRLRCSSDGRQYKLIGWGFWEGAPCGGGKLYPPSPQVRYEIDPTVSFGYTKAGALSVNRKRGGENIIELDYVSNYEKQCVSSEPTPYTVWVRNDAYTTYSYFYVRVDNAPGCNYFTFRVDYAVVEEIEDTCQNFLQKEGCKLVNEYWEDANGKRVQVVRNGKRVVNYNMCEEEVFDNSTKTYTSGYQTLQSPPQNCAGVPKTCRWINGEQVCRTWWKKIREYECTSNPSQVTVDLSQSRRAAETAYLDEETGEWGYFDEQGNLYNPQQECEKICVVRNGNAMDVRQCSNNVCPAGGGIVEEDCKCIKDSNSGLGYAIGAFGAIDEALKNRECVR